MQFWGRALAETRRIPKLINIQVSTEPVLCASVPNSRESEKNYIQLTDFADYLRGWCD